MLGLETQQLEESSGKDGLDRSISLCESRPRHIRTAGDKCEQGNSKIVMQPAPLRRASWDFLHLFPGTRSPPLRPMHLAPLGMDRLFSVGAKREPILLVWVWVGKIQPDHPSSCL
eukprot:scaffold81836_cov18-Tisochrysis_lutea.AAC.6